MTSGLALTVLGSGSRGNALVLEWGEDCLLIDAGFSRLELERRLGQVGIAATRIRGIALTHEHGDHTTGALTLAKRYRIPIHSSLGTWRGLCGQSDPCEFVPLTVTAPVQLGPFSLTACPIPHDATEPLAIAATAPDGTSVAIAQDIGCTTQALRWFLRERHALVLEANHDETMLRTSSYPLSVQDRIAGPGGHLSNREAARLLAEVHHDELRLVVLAHLSQRCNTPDRARDDISAALQSCRYAGELLVAGQDAPLERRVVRRTQQPQLDLASLPR